MASKAITETDILKARESAQEDDSDAWPEFELTNVDVFDATNASTRISLLEASLHSPCRVTGQLQPLPKHQAHLLKRDMLRRVQSLELPEVVTFSYGLYADGNVGLWAGGKAGWYLLKPSRAYRETWNVMIEAVKLLYFIVDAHHERVEKVKKRLAGPLKEWRVQELFEQYSVEVMGIPKMAVEAAHKMYKHKEFLLTSMITGKEGIAWAKNPLYTHLCKRYPKEFEMAKERASVAPADQKTSQNSESASSGTGSLKRKRGKLPKSHSSDIRSIESQSATGADDVSTGHDEASTKSDLKRGHGRHTRNGRSVVQSPETVADVQALPNDSESDSEEVGHAIKGRSALRPKPLKSNKATWRRSGKAPITTMDDEDEEIDEGAQEREDNTEEAIPSRRPSQKRKAEVDGETARSKRWHGGQEMDEGIDIPSSPASTSNLTEHGDGGMTSMKDDGSAADLPLRLLEHGDALQEDTWVCALDGCSHKVYLASQADSQRLIREHYALHAYDDDVRVQLVKKHQHPSLPVSRLMEKVRMQAKAEGFPDSRRGFGGANEHSRYPPRPILRY